MNSRIMNSLKKQKAVYWANPVNDGFGGYSFDAPVEIEVLWENKQEKYINMDAEEKVSQAVVQTSQDVAVKGMISLMEIANISSSELPADNNAYEIKAAGKIPDYKGTNFARQAWL